jgi:hypothetical protein
MRIQDSPVGDVICIHITLFFPYSPFFYFLFIYFFYLYNIFCFGDEGKGTKCCVGMLLHQPYYLSILFLRFVLHLIVFLLFSRG